MSYIKFSWDDSKAKSNLKKHNISFGEAKSVFEDKNARLIPDDLHSQTEDRFILLGLSHTLRILVVVHAYLESDEIIRIISARKATKNEANYYKARK
jgi:uncharacterized protein